MMTRETITVGRQRFRLGPWQADSGIGHLSLPRTNPPPTGAELEGALEIVGARGYSQVLTSAMEEGETEPYVSLGFAERDRLHVLVHRLRDLPDGVSGGRGVRLRRGRNRDRAGALAVDGRAFPEFWRLDADGLLDAETATPTSRFRVAMSAGRLAGYAITGRGGHSGFLQRLATDPSLQRRGIGTDLVRDALRWCLRRHCEQVYVNTQVGNEPAMALYRRVGFESTPNDLVVLSWSP